MCWIIIYIILNRVTPKSSSQRVPSAESWMSNVVSYTSENWVQSWNACSYLWRNSVNTWDDGCEECKKINKSHTHTHTHTHTDREHHPRHRHTHTARTTPHTPKRTPPTNTEQRSKVARRECVWWWVWSVKTREECEERREEPPRTESSRRRRARTCEASNEVVGGPPPPRYLRACPVVCAVLPTVSQSMI